MMTESDLLRLKKQVDDARLEVSELNGRKQSLMDQLKEMGCSSLEEAQREQEKIEKEISRLDTMISQKCKELEEKYQLS